MGQRGDLGRARAAGEQILDQVELCLRRLVALVELQCLVIGLARHLGVNVAEVLVRGGVTGVGTDRHFQRAARLVVLALRGIQHREVVVRLRQLRIILRQFSEDADGFSRFVLLGEQDAAQETAACIFGFGFQILLDALHGAIGLSLFQQLLGFLQIVSLCQHRGSKSHAEEDSGEAGGGRFESHRAMIPKVVVETTVMSHSC